VDKKSERERPMDEKLIARLESAVARLEALSSGLGSGAHGIEEETASDPSIVAFDDLIGRYLGRVSSAAEKIGGQVLEVTKIVQEVFNVQKELLIKAKQTQVSYFLLITKKFLSMHFKFI
jgi:adenylyl cyclase-associated protein